MERLFKTSISVFSVATHDDKLVNEAVRMSEKYSKNFEFALLKGIRDNLKLQLVTEASESLSTYLTVKTGCPTVSED